MAIFQKTKNVVTNRRHLKAVGTPATFAVNGQVVTVGTIVDVGMHEAAGLISRGLAVDATPAEVTAAGANIIVAAARFDSWVDAS